MLLSKGEVPKNAGMNPRGGHLGQQVGVWLDRKIFKEATIPWVVKNLADPRFLNVFPLVNIIIIFPGNGAAALAAAR